MGDKNGTQSSIVTYAQYTVDFSDSFSTFYASLVKMPTRLNILDCIDEFIDHFEKNGLWGWKGKIAPSSRLPVNIPEPKRSYLIAHAEANKLWHAHIGDPSFRDTGHGYSVSDGVLHFQKLSSYSIKLLEVGYHRPMELPVDVD
ncbi:hypothetical protein [Enterobacter hormaechei]|uniref:hypothetical protein n=1 Tax=Enterobacter hormaechei TaxID=158836 RepID=UPI0028749FA2|nr:hypothetical protein [Enterobacter hormaechei]MDS0956170.1 hypothetical protein [Enterobacter hormaechei]